jgi:hypothetical protein
MRKDALLATLRRVAAAAVLQSSHVECCMGLRTLRKRVVAANWSEVEKWRNATSAVTRTMMR